MAHRREKLRLCARRGFGILASLTLGRVEPSVVHGHGSPPCNAEHESLFAVAKCAGLMMTEKQASENVAGSRAYGDSEVAVQSRLFCGNAEIRRDLGEVGIGCDVIPAHHAVPL